MSSVKSFYHYLINKGFPVSIITTHGYIYAAVVTDPVKFQNYIKTLCNTTGKDEIQDELDFLHQNTMSGCPNTWSWQKKSEAGTLAITANNNSNVSGIKFSNLQGKI